MVGNGYWRSVYKCTVGFIVPEVPGATDTKPFIWEAWEQSWANFLDILEFSMQAKYGT